jgi:hypothetical protein
VAGEEVAQSSEEIVAKEGEPRSSTGTNNFLLQNYKISASFVDRIHISFAKEKEIQ